MRDIPVGNGSLLVTFDDKYQIRDIFFPHVGQENHTEGFPFRFGVWADGQFSWVFADEWQRSLRYMPESLVTDVTLTHPELKLELTCSDTIDSRNNIFLRRVRVSDLSKRTRDVRIYLHHDFRIYENKVGDTAYYDPETHALIHYKKQRYFLINTEPAFDAFATGRKAFHDQEGTWRDAEDGTLHGGAITEGSVDSTIGIYFSLVAGETLEFYYWIAAGHNHAEVAELNSIVHTRRPEAFLAYTENYWRAWVNKNDDRLSELPAPVLALYKRSLLILNTQIDRDGAILAANDWDVTERATDHYSYLWTRDGSFVANALDRAGYPQFSQRFLEFCGRVCHPDGYFLQKYNPDGTVASGWHASWDAAGKRKMVPIQEDETALVLWALWEHYRCYRDIDLAHRLYSRMVIRCADFMAGFRDMTTGLPLPSWNLWEDRRGVHTFTCSTVVAGLRSAAEFARLFSDRDKAAEWDKAADEIVVGIREHLFSDKLGRFLRGLLADGNDKLTADPTVDASLFGVFYFDCFNVDDPVVAGTMTAIEQKLSSGTQFNGIARYENDGYMRVSDAVPGNSWFICTLWLAEYHIAKAKNGDDLAPALDILEWCVERALPSGVLAEQVDPLTGKELSVSPLTWSHSTFVATVRSYIAKIRAFKDEGVERSAISSPT
jgi:oligosaccharide amylase